jgi:hypothetical protein
MLVEAVVKREKSLTRELVAFRLASVPVVDATPRVAWPYAGIAQVGSAVAEARREGRSVLVGLSGSETC